MRLLDTFDRICVINLPERTDRRRDMLGELARAGLAEDTRVSFFEAIRPADAGDFTSIGARGVYESQKAILADAARAGSSVLILEDDCTFAPEVAGYETTRNGNLLGGITLRSGDLHQSDTWGPHDGFSAAVAALMTEYLHD